MSRRRREISNVLIAVRAIGVSTCMCLTFYVHICGYTVLKDEKLLFSFFHFFPLNKHHYFSPLLSSGAFVF